MNRSSLLALTTGALLVAAPAGIAFAATPTPTPSGGMSPTTAPSAAPTSSSRAATVSSQDREYVQKSGAGDLFEIEGGKMAESKGVNPAIKALGARLVTDHSTSLSDTRDLASKLGITLPSQPTSEMQAILAKYQAASGSAFDKVFAEEEVSDHKQDISDATTEISQGTNAEVIADAQKELPVLRTHLALSERALSIVSGTFTGGGGGASTSGTTSTPSTVRAGSGGGADRSPLLPGDTAAVLAGAGTLLAGASLRRLVRRA